MLGPLDWVHIVAQSCWQLRDLNEIIFSPKVSNFLIYKVKTKYSPHRITTMQ